MLVSYFHRNTGHQGIKRTLENLSKFYYWPRMTKDIKTILSNCLSCAMEKAKFFDIPTIKAT